MEEKFLKLTNAVYGILAFFPESDPLKNKAKEKVLAIMENLTLDKLSVHSRIFEDIEILLNYLKIAESQGWINSVNYLIISNGYEKIKKEIGLPQNISQNMPEDSQVAQESKEPVLTEEDLDFSARQNKIIKFLEEKGKAQVMDLQTILPDITKRTIRRDIDDLLEKGKITRMGEFNQIFYKTKQS
jgi:Fic family protein